MSKYMQSDCLTIVEDDHVNYVPHTSSVGVKVSVPVNKIVLNEHWGFLNLCRTKICIGLCGVRRCGCSSRSCALFWCFALQVQRNFYASMQRKLVWREVHVCAEQSELPLPVFAVFVVRIRQSIRSCSDIKLASLKSVCWFDLAVKFLQRLFTLNLWVFKKFVARAQRSICSLISFLWIFNVSFSSLLLRAIRF